MLRVNGHVFNTHMPFYLSGHFKLLGVVELKGKNKLVGHKENGKILDQFNFQKYDLFDLTFNDFARICKAM